MKVTVFLFCYNEELLLPHSINHYRKTFPDVEFYIDDNESTDNSIKIAQELGCNVISFNTNKQSNV